MLISATPPGQTGPSLQKWVRVRTDSGHTWRRNFESSIHASATRPSQMSQGTEARQNRFGCTSMYLVLVLYRQSMDCYGPEGVME